MSMTNDVNHNTRLMIVYTRGILLVLSRLVPTSPKSVALMFNTCDFFPYIASTIACAANITSMPTVFHTIIVHAFFFTSSSGEKINQKTRINNITNSIPMMRNIPSFNSG